MHTELQDHADAECNTLIAAKLKRRLKDNLESNDQLAFH